MTAPPQWDASVVEVWDDGDTFTADLRREGHPDLLAEFSMKQCGITVEAGDVLIVTPESVTKRRGDDAAERRVTANCRCGMLPAPGPFHLPICAWFEEYRKNLISLNPVPPVPVTDGRPIMDADG